MEGLLNCLFSCDLERLKILLKKADINRAIPGTEGCTPLHVMAGIDTVNNKEPVLTYLLENEADPNARSYENLTPVHIACMWNKCLELEKLLQYGGNPWLTDIENKNSFDMAADNKCHEAYHLLNIYLHEEKLNFKPERKISKEVKVASPTSLNICNTFEGVETKDLNASTNCTFMTANENFPVLFYSTDESEDCFGDVSKFLKKKNISRHTDKKVLPREKKASDTSTFGQDKWCCDKMNTNISTDESKSQKRSCKSNFHDAYVLSHTDCDTSEVSNSELNDSSDSSYGRVIDSDLNSGIFLIEVKNNDSKLNSNESSCSEGGDWKSYRSINANCSTKTYCSSHSKLSLIIPNELNEYSNSKIFEELRKLGDDPGPVLDHTRQVYLHRLAKLKSGCITCCDLPKPKYCPELYLFLENKMDMERAHFLEHHIGEEFAAETDKKWREGNQRSCFNYFLLDPRVTQNLPLRALSLTNEQAFLIFLDALFYVGKGTRGRPYSHLFEAAKSLEDDRPKSDKVNHILDIWDSGLGVISIHCFHNSIPVEAYTREACIIEAVGLENLTNVKKGDFYGLSARLTTSRKRLIGISLLNKAFQIFLLEGERLIKPKDVQNR